MKAIPLTTIVLFVAVSVCAQSKKETMTYPEHGTVVAEPQRDVYTIQTDAATYGILGRPALQLNQVIQFRLDGKNRFYTVLSDGKEHRYFITQQELRQQSAPLQASDQIQALQQSASSIGGDQNGEQAPTQPASLPSSSGSPRVFVTASDSWFAAGGFGVSNGSGGGSMAAGSDPQTVQLIEDFGRSCHSVIVTSDKNNADYVVLFDRNTVKRVAGGVVGVLSKVDKIAIFKRNGDAVFSESARSVEGTVKDACKAIDKSR